MNKNPEEWEASDHIENLKAGIGHEGLCKFHDDLTRALIWMIRHLELAEKQNNGNGKLNLFVMLAKQSPVGLLAMALFFTAWVFGKMNGVIP